MRERRARLRQATALAVVLAAWETAARRHWLAPVMPAPSAVARALLALARDGSLFRDALASVERVIVGFSAAAVAGVGLAALLARSEPLADCLVPLIELLRPISVIAWVPIAVLWFGIGDGSAWFVIFIGGFFAVFTNAFAGFRSVARAHVEAARCLGAGPLLFVREVLWPSALPHILTGLRIGSGTAWTAVIAAELISGRSGLGYMIELSRMMIETENVLAGMIVIGLIGLAMNAGFVWLEGRLIPWREERT